VAFVARRFSQNFCSRPQSWSICASACGVAILSPHERSRTQVLSAAGADDANLSVRCVAQIEFLKPRHIIIAVAVAFLCLGILFIASVWFFRRSPHIKLARDHEANSVLLVSKEGERYVGEQLRFFVLDGDGVISATNIVSLNLYYTEGRPFRLSGQLWLEPIGKASNADLPDGFALFIREWDSLHRYSLRTRSMEVKRRLREGFLENGIRQAVSFQPPVFATWIPFSADVSAEGISFQIGDQSGVIAGPLDIDGANKIAIAPGTKLKDVRLEILARGK
jgi:hypothetical protein